MCLGLGGDGAEQRADAEVTTMASTPQKATRAAPRQRGAARSGAERTEDGEHDQRHDADGWDDSRCRVSHAARSGSAAPAVNVAAEVSAAWMGLAA